MKYFFRCFSAFGAIALLGCVVSACGGSSRYDPGPPDVPTGLTAQAGEGQVALNWSAASKAAAYNVYYSKSSPVDAATATKVASLPSTSTTVTGLTDDVPYYFVVRSINANSESAASNEASATPFVPGDFVQANLDGTWRFNILSAGGGAGWMRGTLTVAADGTASVTAFQNSSGASNPGDAPAGLFPALFVSASGRVVNASSGTGTFKGVLAGKKDAQRRKMIVGTWSSSGTESLAILQKKEGSSFVPADVQGFGTGGGGSGTSSRRFAYSQISSGSTQEWEFATGKIGSAGDVTYSTLAAPSNPTWPNLSNKVTTLSISGDGIASEARSSAAGQPPALITAGVMSDDRSVIVATETDASGSGSKYILRIYQFINLAGGCPSSFTEGDLSGTYGVAAILVGGSSPVSASGTEEIASSGLAHFTGYSDSGGGSTPGDLALTLPSTALTACGSSVKDGLVESAGSTLNGKLSYFRDMLVLTSDASGVARIKIGLK